MAKRVGYRAIYLSGGGVAAGSLGMPDLGISNLDDVLTDIRRITDVCDLPLLVDVDTGFGASAFNVARTTRSLIKFGAAAMHIEDQVGAKRCGHRPGKELVSKEEMADRIKAAVDARTDPGFVIMARTDALANEGLDTAIERPVRCVEAGADMIFPEAITELPMYKKFADAVKVPILANITEFGKTPLFTVDELRSADVAMVALSADRVPRHEQGGAQGLREPAQERHAEGRRSATCRRARSSTTSSTTTPTRKSWMSSSPAAAPKPKKSVALSGVPAGNTALCTVGRSGNDLHYRGYDILDFADAGRIRGGRLSAGAREAADPRRAEEIQEQAQTLRGAARGRCKTALERLPKKRASDGRDAHRVLGARHARAGEGRPRHGGRAATSPTG